MSIVVWDGKVLATDRAASDGAVMWETIKAWYHTRSERSYILTGVGSLSHILLMRDWYIRGHAPDEFPKEQRGAQWCHFLVVSSKGLWRFEQLPVAIEHGTTPCAFGVGREIAFGALAMGASAYEAVEIVNKHSPHSGMGVATYELGENDE